MSTKKRWLVDSTLPGEPGRRAARDFADDLPANGSLLGLDLSRRRIGVAGTDAGRRLVTPLCTIARKSLDADVGALRSLAEARGTVGLVIGLPLNMDGRQGEAAQAVRAAAGRLARALALPALLQDERLTTEAVRAAVAEGRLVPKKGETVLDHYAAAVILEDALRDLDDQ